ncbi:retention module-containing protein, partial [Pseudomonas sp.]|uniref:retention module-containing protein n=1 Tax=Pseudomonas sp. TaxID=306 RepID=UPI00262D4463
MSSVVAIVKSIVGQVIAISPEGIKRVLIEGDHLLAGEQIETGASGAVSLQLNDGRVLDVGRDSEWSAVNPQVSTQVSGQTDAQLAASSAPSTAELQKAIADGVDPTKAFEAAAAGTQVVDVGPGGEAGGGHSFVVLDATAATVAPTIGYSTAGLGNGTGTTTEQTDGTTQLRASTLTLTATQSLAETGGVLTYTATVTQAPLSTLTITLSNGQSIVIGAGQLTGTVNVAFASENTPYIDAHTVSVTVTGTTGGQGLSITTDPTPAITQITDTIDPTQVSITAPTSTVGEGSSLTYTISVANAPQTNLVLTLSDGNTVTIVAGTKSVDYTVNVGDADHGNRPDDIYSQGTTSTTLSVTGVSNGADGNLESVVTTGATVTTNIVDALTGSGTDTKIGFISGSDTVNEGSAGTYTLNVPTTTAPLVLTLTYTGTASNGADFTGTTTVTLPAGQNSFNISTLTDSLLEGNESITLTLTGVSGGGLESPTVDATLSSVTTTIIDQTPAEATGSTVGGTEDTATTLIWADFGVQTGSSNADLGMRINSVPTNGTLTLTETVNGVSTTVTVTAGTVITKADIDNGKLVFTPDANAASTPSDSTVFAQINFTTLNNATSATPVEGTTTTVNLTIAAVADAATFSAPAASTGNEDSAITIKPITVSFADNDGSEVHSITASTLPVGSVLSDGSHSVTVGDSGSVDITTWSLSTLTVTPPANYNSDLNGNISLTVTAVSTETSNGDTATSTQTYPVVVNAVNDAPIATASTAAVTEDTTVTGQLQATDVDNGDVLTYTVKASDTPAGF